MAAKRVRYFVRSAVSPKTREYRGNTYVYTGTGAQADYYAISRELKGLERMKAHTFRVNWSSLFLLGAVILTIVLAASCGSNDDECKTETGQTASIDQTAKGASQTSESQPGLSDSDESSNRQACADSAPTDEMGDAASTESPDSLSPKRDAGIPDTGNSSGMDTARMVVDSGLDAAKECRTPEGEIACQTDKSCIVNVACSSPSVYLFKCLNCPQGN